LTRYCSSACFH